MGLLQTVQLIPEHFNNNANVTIPEHAIGILDNGEEVHGESVDEVHKIARSQGHSIGSHALHPSVIEVEKNNDDDILHLPYNIKTHNGTITVESGRTGQYRTFRIHTQKKDANFAPGSRVLSILIGPDNESNYKGFAFINDDGTVKIWKRQDTPLHRKYVDIVANPSKWQGKVEYLFEGRCIRCNRKLTTPESIRSGIGPVCEGRDE